MSYVLRHGADKEGIHMNSGGYVMMADLLQYLNRGQKKVTKEFIYSIVEDNEKKRYEVLTEDGIEYIRAA